MNINHLLHIHDGDIVQALRKFLSEWWLQVELDALLAPVELPQHGGVVPKILTRPAETAKVNPFAPVMLSNTAAMVEGFIRDHPRSRLAVILRPCELRALVELQKHGRVHFTPAAMERTHESLVILGVDCPGTFLPAEYKRHIERHQDDAEMIKVSLTYEKLHSYVPDAVRSACKVCDTPAPLGADITIGSIGTAPDGYLLVIARDEIVNAKLKLEKVTDGIAAEKEVVSREVMVGKLVDQRAKLRSELIHSQAHLADDLNASFAQLARCSLCADCLDACPLYKGELTGMLGVREARPGKHPLLAELVNVSRWLASCSGCGMCQEACEHGVALTPLVTVLSHRIQQELNYRPGDPSQRLPWTA